MSEGEVDTALLRRSQILCSAVNRIAAEGMRGARLKDIADDAGVSLGLVQHYFRARDALVEEAFATMMRISSRSWTQLYELGDDPLVKILAGLRLQAFGSVDFEARWSFWSELWTAGTRNPSLRTVSREIYRDWYDGLARSIDELAASGRIPQATVADPPLAVMAVIDGLGAHSLVEPERLDPEKLHRVLVDTVCAILSIDREEAGRLDTVAASLIAEISPEPLSPDVIARALAGEASKSH